jgi:PAS domain S-box-containing protein
MIVTLVLMGVVSAGVLTVFCFFHERHCINEIIDKQYVVINKSEVIRFQARLSQFKENLMKAAAMPHVQELISARDNGNYDPESGFSYIQCVQRLELIFAAMQKNSDRYVRICILDQTGQEMVRVDWNGKEAIVVPAHALQHTADSPYFLETSKLSAGQVYISELDMNQERENFVIPHQPVIRMATPVFNRLDQFRGILLVYIDADIVIHGTLPAVGHADDSFLTFLTTINGFNIHFIKYFSAVMILVVGLAIVIAVFLSRLLAAPLNSLRIGSKQIASGKLDHRIHLMGSPEFDELARDFNEMADMLETSYRSLQAEYQHLFDNTNDAIMIHDLNGKILNINETTVRRLGYDRKELLTKKFEEICTSEEAQLAHTRQSSIIEKGTQLYESIYQRKDGSVIPVEISSTILSYRGKPAIQSIVRDISERKQIEEGLVAALNQNAQLYELVMQEKLYAETVIQSISDGVVTMDRDRVILSWNNGAEKITGFEGQAVLGKTCFEILAHQDESGRLFCETDHCPALRALDPNCSDQTENVFIRNKSGRLIPVSMSLSSIVDGSGENIGAVKVFRDISKEAELIRNIQLVSQAKSNFLASMSHELRTPLNAILGFSEVLLEEFCGPINDKQREYISDVISSGKLLLSLIDDILDLSKIEAGKMELELGQFYIPEILESSLLLVRTNAIRNGIHLNLDIPKDMETFQIEVDKGKVIHVLYNLLSNAIKFTPNGGSIVLKVQFSDPSSKILQIIVEDTGIGIDPDLTGRIFDNFYQIQNGVLNKTSGAGLGLPISRQIIRLHGGDIRAESKGLGYGSRFVVEIPSLQQIL